MSFPAYPDYKHSGVELLAEYPSHWTLKRFKNVFEERAERSSDGSEELLSVSAYFGVKPRSETLDEGDHLSRAESLEGYKVCKAGDLVINIMLAWNRGLGFSWQHGIVSPAYSVFHVTDGSYPKFLDYLVRSDECIRYFKTHSAGIMDSRLRLYPESFGRLFSAIPPACEQTQIARFLDHETARIDALIEEQQRLIELLKEKRQAVISHAVTKGLDPAVPMKDSGVEWLGEVPAHWDVLNFNLLVYIAEGQVNPRVQPYSEMLLIAPNHVESGTGRLIHTETAEEQGADSGKYVCQKGDVIYSKIRPALRKVCLAPEACLCSADMYPMRGVSGLDNEYLFWFILSEPFSAFALLESDRVAMPKINRESLGGLKLARPPLEEQKAISEFLVRETLRIDALIDAANSGVGLLNERRSALISAAVTGKIDVRGWLPPASTQAPELAVVEAN